MTGTDNTFGQDLLARAREHGMTSEDLASLLRLSVNTIRHLASPTELDRYSVAVLHQLAEHLDLPWPGWLTATAEWPQPAAPETRSDAHRVHAVLSAAIGCPLNYSEIAQVLDWTTERVRDAAEQLTTRARPGGGTRLTVTGDTLTLDVAPRMLNTDSRQRLNKLLHAHGIGPQPHVLYMINELADPSGPRRDWLHQDPALVEEALDYGLITCRSGDAVGEPPGIELHPDVMFSLGVTPYLLDQTPDQ